MKIGELIQSGDWKGEKHVPVIEAPAKAGSDEFFDVVLSVGKEIPHPNTAEHHICWIKLFFKPKDEKFPHEVGELNFSSHQGPAQCDPFGTIRMKVASSGTLLAVACCNIHGLWESSAELTVE